MKIRQRTIKAFFITILSSVLINAFSQQTLVSPRDGHIQYEGRVPMTDTAATFLWPGTAITLGFKGTNLSGVFRDADTANYYDVIVDGQVTHKNAFYAGEEIVCPCIGLA